MTTARSAHSAEPGVRQQRRQERRRLVREEVLAVVALVIALAVTLTLLGLQWLGNSPATSSAPPASWSSPHPGGHLS